MIGNDGAGGDAFNQINVKGLALMLWILLCWLLHFIAQISDTIQENLQCNMSISYQSIREMILSRFQ